MQSEFYDLIGRHIPLSFCPPKRAKHLRVITIKYIDVLFGNTGNVITVIF